MSKDIKTMAGALVGALSIWGLAYVLNLLTLAIP